MKALAPSLVMRRIAAASSSTTIGASPSSGSSSNNSAGLVISARAIASICCSPPDNLITEIAPPLGKPRKQVVHLRQVPSAGTRGDGEIFLHRQRRKNLALLRHPADAGPGAPMRRALRDVLAAPQDLAAADPRIAHDGE